MTKGKTVIRTISHCTRMHVAAILAVVVIAALCISNINTAFSVMHGVKQESWRNSN